MWNSSEIDLTTAVSTKTEYGAMVIGLQFDNLHEFQAAKVRRLEILKWVQGALPF
jgi:hypothetical protein